MPEDVAIDPQNADAAAILRDLAEAKDCGPTRSSYKLMLLKGALEHLMMLERRNDSPLSPRVVQHLRSTVLRELQNL
jgi:hypothetical protein